MGSDLTAYPEICNAEELTSCLPDSGIVEACGFEGTEEKRTLESMLAGVRKGKKIRLVDPDRETDERYRDLRTEVHTDSLIVRLEREPTGWPVEGTLLCVDEFKDSQRDKLLQKLYEADHRILGLITRRRTKK